jgi:(2Fe-2S) ferredoxin
LDIRPLLKLSRRDKQGVPVLPTAPFEKHIFVCENEREPGHPRGCCKAKGGEELRAVLKDELKKRGLHGRMRANGAGCLDQCELGVSCVVYPEGVWYTLATADDVRAVVEEHLVQGRPVERLKMKLKRALSPTG